MKRYPLGMRPAVSAVLFSCAVVVSLGAGLRRENDRVGQVPQKRRDARPFIHRTDGTVRPVAPPRVKAVKKRRVAFQIAPGGNVLILADQEVVQQLELARKLLDRKQYPNAVLLLQRIIERNRDAFYYPDPLKRKLLKSVRLSAQRMIGSLPQAGQKAYRLKYSVPAQQELAAAYKTGKPLGIAAVARTFFHTAAGYEAMYRMGTIHFDRSQPLAAAVCFEKVRQVPAAAKRWEPTLSLRTAICWHHAGFPEKAGRALAAVKRIQGNRPLILGGRRVPIFANPKDGPVWLARTFPRRGNESGRLRSNWTVYRGGPSRNPIALTAVGLPQKSWRMNTVLDLEEPSRDQRQKVDSPDVTRMKGWLKSLADGHRGQNAAAFADVHPIVVNGTALFRSPGCLRAIDLKTGKRLWESVPDDALDSSLMTLNEALKDRNTPVRNVQILTANCRQLIDQRLWGDATWGTISSDGERVYAVEELGSSRPLFSPTVPPSRPIRRVPQQYNRLVAYNLRTGRQVWSLGGAADADVPDSQPDTFFLGSPLPLAGRLYCLAEHRGEIRLMVFEHREEGNGRTRRQWAELVWTQPLVGPNRRISQDATRRTAGTTVSFADGILVCPTDAGYVIALDLTSRTLLWGYRYESSQNPRPPFPRPRPQPGRLAGWQDSTCTIADGKVLLTPPGTNEILCLKLLDGTLLWRKKREDGLYVAGVKDDRVLIVGSASVRAVSLKDGTPSWKNPRTIAKPSGRAIIVGDRLLIPLSTAHIASVDLKTGRLLSRTKRAGGRIPGNLILSGNVLISQGIDSIEILQIPRTKKRATPAEP